MATLLRIAKAQFLSTPSVRRATLVAFCTVVVVRDFYPRPPRGGRPLWVVRSSGSAAFLSTPSARRATQTYSDTDGTIEISIHALHEEGDIAKMITSGTVTVFLSTPSARRATALGGPQLRISGISIHALREEGDTRDHCRADGTADFYPRPPRGGRPSLTLKAQIEKIFLSTPSARRATAQASPGAGAGGISIHALREEGDTAGCYWLS